MSYHSRIAVIAHDLWVKDMGQLLDSDSIGYRVFLVFNSAIIYFDLVGKNRVSFIVIKLSFFFMQVAEQPYFAEEHLLPQNSQVWQ